MFSFCVYGIFTKKRVLFDNSELMQSYKYNCQSVKLVNSYQKST